MLPYSEAKDARFAPGLTPVGAIVCVAALTGYYRWHRRGPGRSPGETGAARRFEASNRTQTRVGSKSSSEETMPFDGTEFQRHDFMLEKLDGVIDLLRTENRWCKQRLRTADGKRCILGALMDVSADAILTHPILDAARELTGRSYRRIEGFNDDPRTDHRLVVTVLGRTRDNLLLGKVAAAPPTVPRRVRAFYSALRLLGR